MAEKKGWSKDKQGLTGKRTQHHDSDDKVTGSSRKEHGLSGEYIEHRDSDGKVTGHSTKQHGLFKGDYVEHRDKDGKVIGSSKKEHGLAGDYVEHRDRDDRVIGWSRNEQGPFRGKYTQHHGTSYRYSDDEETSESQNSESSSSSGSDSGGSSDGGAAAGAGILLIPLALIVGAGWLVCAFFRLIVTIFVDIKDDIWDEYRRYRKLNKQERHKLWRKLRRKYAIPVIALTIIAVISSYSPRPATTPESKPPKPMPTQPIPHPTIIEGWNIRCLINKEDNAVCSASKDNLYVFITNSEYERISVMIDSDRLSRDFSFRVDDSLFSMESHGNSLQNEQADAILQHMRTGKIVKTHYRDPSGKSINKVIQLGNFSKTYSTLEHIYHGWVK